ncbi:acyltransferase [Flavobacterium sp. LT1R49]|uniref:acyltransferase n=1 Tax=Flavobacterium arabinosi TaxID=3398737 RepID=UPI003A83CA46
MKSLRARIIFHVFHKIGVSKRINTSFWKFLGLKIGQGTYIGKNTKVTWPHQVELGNNCRLEHGIYFHYDGIYSQGPSICIGNDVFIGNNTEFNITDRITIGSNCLIAAGCRFVDHNHGLEKSMLIRNQLAPKSEIILEEDVWLGCNVVVLIGVKIGKGAVIAAGSIVNKNIPSYEIWGGVPAKKIGKRKTT